MNRILGSVAALAVAVGALTALGCSGTSGTAPQGAMPPAAGTVNTLSVAARIHPGPSTRVCDAASEGFASCAALRRTDVGRVGDDARPVPIVPNAGTCPNAAIAGYQPCDLQTAYALPSSTAGGGQTVGIVDAFDDPNAEADLGVYRSTFGLSPCTTANGCFRKVNQSGVQGNYPRRNGGWAQEISLDLDMASAICPNCKILLVEGSSNSFADLAASENTAVSLGANVVSNSYGGNESSSVVSTYGGSYNHPGATIVASSGDAGFSATAQFPADLNTVAAAGGTSLTSVSPLVESAWSGAGSGCSAFVAQPSWQSGVANITSVCSRRAYADVSAVADPNTGVAVYDTFRSSGWLVFGGTSVSSPILASVYALAGNAASSGPAYPYSHTSGLNDITSGSNGACGTNLCNATAGWDGPTGLGSPNGTSAF